MTITTKVTIDTAGRIVVPKAVRDAMGLRGGSILEMEFEAGMLSFTLPSVMREQVDERGRVYFVGPSDAQMLSDDDVRNVLESVRP